MQSIYSTTVSLLFIVIAENTGKVVPSWLNPNEQMEMAVNVRAPFLSCRFLNLCKAGINTSLCLGTVLKNNDTSAQ